MEGLFYCTDLEKIFISPVSFLHGSEKRRFMGFVGEFLFTDGSPEKIQTLYLKKMRILEEIENGEWWVTTGGLYFVWNRGRVAKRNNFTYFIIVQMLSNKIIPQSGGTPFTCFRHLAVILGKHLLIFFTEKIHGRPGLFKPIQKSSQTI